MAVLSLKLTILKAVKFIGWHGIILTLGCLLTLAYAQKAYAKVLTLDQIIRITDHATTGGAELQYLIAASYEHGWAGFEKNPVFALRWYKKSATSGHPEAQFQLAKKYHDGKGATQDIALARKWYLKAARQGDVNSQINLGYIYNIGQGIERDDNKAFFWYQKAALSGEPTAQHNLSILYQYGYGVTKNTVKAKYWLEKSKISPKKNDITYTQTSVESALTQFVVVETKPTSIIQELVESENQLPIDALSNNKDQNKHGVHQTIKDVKDTQAKQETLTNKPIIMPANFSLSVPSSKPYQFINQNITIKWKSKPVLEFRYLDILFVALVFFAVSFVIYPHFVERRKFKSVQRQKEFASYYFENNRKILRMTYLRYPDANNIDRQQKQQLLFVIVVLMVRYVLNDNDKNLIQSKMSQTIKKGLKPYPFPVIDLLLPIANHVHTFVLQDLRCVELSEHIPRTPLFQFPQKPESRTQSPQTRAHLQLV